MAMMMFFAVVLSVVLLLSAMYLALAIIEVRRLGPADNRDVGILQARVQQLEVAISDIRSEQNRIHPPRRWLRAEP